LSRRVIGIATALVALLAAYGCGAQGDSTSVRSGHAGQKGTVAAAAGAVDGSALQTVSYQGLQFDVPASWPVYDLAANPTTCVRFDVNAVYLGHPSDQMQCPAVIVGRADAVLVEPTDGAPAAAGVTAAAAGPTTEAVNDLQAQVVDGGSVTSQVEASFAPVGVSATLTFRDSDATAQQILRSFRSAAR
jgi:hypothetical protein